MIERIKPYNDKYKDQVIELIVNIQRNEFNLPVTIDDQPDLLDIPSHYQVDNGNFWLYLDDDRVVGTISLFDLKDSQAALRKLFVKKEYRGKERGVAKRLLETLLHWGRYYEFEELYLSTSAQFVAAQRFYEKNNFSIVTTEEIPEKFPRMIIDYKYYHRKVLVPVAC